MRPGDDAGDQEIVESRILYWGIEGSGKSTNLRTIHAKLRPDNRGELREIPTRIDPTVRYEVLPIELGEVRGVRTRLQIIAVPGAPEQAPTRKQLLDCVDGVVFVIDSQRDRIDENVASFDELRRSLSAYGRSLDSLAVVVQYNKHDLADPVALEDLHRKLDVSDAAVFETVATEPGGPLRTLTTISKRVMRVLREREPATVQPVIPEPAAPDPIPVEAPVASPAPAPPIASEPRDLLEEAILAEPDLEMEMDSDDIADAVLDAQTALDRPWQELESEALASAGGLRIGPDMRILSVGDAVAVAQRTVRLPLVLGNDDGETVTLSLTLKLDPLLDEEGP